jgi:carbon-monoxide dehydrogenase large subunit
VGESPNIGGVSAFSNAVVDAFAHLGVTHLPMPHTAARLWRGCHDHGLTGPATAAD